MGGGDCCVKSLKKPINKKYCKQCKCLDPKNQPGKADDKPKCDKSKNKYGAVKYKGDGDCDDENNNCGCEFDGGDCCAKTLKKAVNKKYCKSVSAWIRRANKHVFVDTKFFWRFILRF